MNATNLGTQPEHRKLYARDSLQAAAIEYKLSVDALSSADACGVPRHLCDQLSRNVSIAVNELLEAAMEYGDNAFDGAPNE